MEGMTQALITGGEGALAQAVAGSLEEAGMVVEAPGRGELDVCDEVIVGEYFSGLGELDLLVCNAGGTYDELLLKMDEGCWDGVMDVNLRGAFLCAKAAGKLMMKQRGRGGHIVFVSSYSAFHPPVGQANYGAAKAALKGLALSLAKELGGRNIRVNVVVPGFMETRMTEGVSGARREAVMGDHALGEFNTVEATGKFLRCLHFDMPFTSGQVFNLDSRVI
ncbi:MAG: SDR family NAD(P)-dependent oxidoreductase [Akkermansiaceae bacterium]